MILHPLQALAIGEAAELGGAVILLPVGQGKTLVSFLLPTAMEAKRPLLLVPGKLRHKTAVEFRQLEKHWQRPKNLVIESYETVSNNPNFISNLRPDLIIADESHKLKNPKAGCTKRVWKFWRDNEIAFVPMSGTLTNRSFFDWWHLQAMALPDDLCVLPFAWTEAALWSSALDEKTTDRVGLGALKAFGATVPEAREGYGRLLKRVPGVIAAETKNVSASILIEVKKLDFSEITKNIDTLKKDWVLPDGTEITEASDFWRHSREIANGFFYRWAEEPPEEWREARRAYHRHVREALRCSRKWETPSQVREALRNDAAISNWNRIEKTFEPRTEAVWLDESVVEIASKAAGLVWYEHKAVGAKLAQHLPTFGSQGRNIKTGQSIIDFNGAAAAVSVGALGEGFNLQRWSSNTVLNCTPSGKTWEQMMGRTHRAGQEADTVTFELLTTTEIQRNDFKQALADAEYTQATTGQQQKLCLADIVGAL